MALLARPNMAAGLFAAAAGAIFLAIAAALLAEAQGALSTGRDDLLVLSILGSFALLYLLVLAMTIGGLRLLAQARRDGEESSAALAASETLFRAALNSLDQGVMVLDPGRRVTTWNDAFTRISPFVAERLRVGMTFEQMIGIAADVAVEHGIEADRNRYVAMRMARHAELGVPFEIEMANQRIVEVCDRPTRDGGLLITYRDVTAERRAQAATRASEAVFRDSIEACEDGLVIFDADFNVIHWNSQYERIFPHLVGNLRPGMAQQRILELHAASDLYAIPPEARAAWIEERQNRLLPGKTAPDQRLSDGRTLRGFARNRQSGGSIVTVRDITAETKTTEALADAKARAEASEARFRDFAEASSDWFWEAGPDGKLTYLSSGIMRFGLDPATLIGRRRIQLPYTVPSGQPGVARIAQATAEQVPFKDVEFEGVLLDGRRAMISVSGRPLFAEDGTYLGHRGSGRDVTDITTSRRRLEAALAELQASRDEAQRLALVAQHTDSAVIITNARGEIEWINPAFTRITGYALDEIVGRVPAHLLQAPETDPETIRTMREALARGDGFHVEVVNVAKDGRRYWVEIECSPVRDAAGTVVRYIAIEADITERKEQQQRLAATLARERDVAAQQRRFISIAAHEFRTPLTIIDGAAQRLARNAADQKPEALRERVDRIRGAVARMSQLIDTTLNSARLDAGSIELNLARLDLVPLLVTAVKRHEEIAPEFRFSLVSNTRSVAVLADARLLDQVVSNLLSNAIKYSGASRRVELALHADAARARITIRDYGIGVPEAELPQLFTRFFRASTAKDLPGTGIGLNLVKELVALHKGDVAVASKVGEGTTFTITLPSAAAVAAEPAVSA